MLQVDDLLDDWQPSKRKKANNGENEVKILQQQGKELELLLFDGVNLMKLIVDPVSLGFGAGLPDNHFTSRVNDCRQNIHVNRMFPKDENRLNCQFVTANVNNWPSIFLIAIENISKGDQLWSYYGNQYKTVLKNANEYEKEKEERSEHIQTVIIKNNTLDGTQREQYLI